jgi:hypothetical protein
VTCDHCDQPWEVASPGRPEVHESGILLRAGITDRLWCRACAVAAGWPWCVSEKQGKGKAA